MWTFNIIPSRLLWLSQCCHLASVGASNSVCMLQLSLYAPTQFECCDCAPYNFVTVIDKEVSPLLRVYYTCRCYVDIRHWVAQHAMNAELSTEEWLLSTCSSELIYRAAFNCTVHCSFCGLIFAVIVTASTNSRPHTKCCIDVPQLTAHL